MKTRDELVLAKVFGDERVEYRLKRGIDLVDMVDFEYEELPSSEADLSLLEFCEELEKRLKCG